MSWRLALALMLPTSALAAPQGDPPPAPVQYAVELPPVVGVSPHGWGLYAIVKGRGLDLSSRNSSWSDDSAGAKSDLEAGYGWWGRSSSAIVGYVEHNPRPAFAPSTFGARDPSEHRMRTSGVLGVGLTLRGR